MSIVFGYFRIMVVIYMVVIIAAMFGPIQLWEPLLWLAFALVLEWVELIIKRARRWRNAKRATRAATNG